MIDLVHIENGLSYKAIQWTGKNAIEVKQFGKTPTQGFVKVNCSNICYINSNGSFQPISVSDWIICCPDNKGFLAATDEELKTYFREG